MAYSRPVRATGVIRGASTAVEGIVGFSISTRLTYSTGKSGADIGPTSMDLNGLEGTITITSDSIATITALSNHTVEALVLKYKVSTGTARKRTIDNVKFGRHSTVNVPQKPGQTNSVRYQVTGRIIFAPADAALSDAMAVASDA